MDVNALRLWGIVTSGAVMAAALMIALQPSPPAQAAPQVQSETRTAAPLSFVVRFRGGGPIARAQAAAERGSTEAPQHTIEAQLVRQTAFAGLCFDRFTAGAAEVVLRTCEPVAASEQAELSSRWLTRLRAMRAVAYADANATAAPNAPVRR